MRKNKSTSGFTLWEILVGITIISIIIIGISRINFSRGSDLQTLQIETTKVISIIEEKRNNSLIGKGVLSGSTLVNPILWTNIIDTAGSGSIQSYYTLESGATGGLVSWAPPRNYSISSLECLRVDDTDESVTGPIALEFKGSEGTVRGCSDPDLFKKVRLQISKGNLGKSITFNALTGTIEQD